MGQTTEAGDLLERLRAGDASARELADRAGPGAVRGPGPCHAPALSPRPALGGDRRPAPGGPGPAAPEPGRGPARGRPPLRQPGGDPDPPGVDRPGPQLPRTRRARGQPSHRRHRPRRAGWPRSPTATGRPESLEEWAAFHEAVDRLPEEEREVMDLLWYRGLTHAQAAEALGVATKTVQRRWASARLLIRDALDGERPQGE